MRVTDESFDDFVLSTGASLVRFGTGLAGSVAAGEDLAQEALARCWRRWARSSFPEHPEAYARRVLLHLHLRDRDRRPPPDDGARRADTFVDDASASVDDRALLWQALACLSHPQRAVLVLRYYEDLPDERIADLLDCSASTVRSHAARALAKLRSVDALHPHPGANR